MSAFPPMKEDVRIAAVTLPCPLDRTSETLDRVEHYAREARSKGAALVAFPEMTLTGYSVSDPLPHPLALDSPHCKAVSEIARYQNIVLLVGLAELGPKGQTYATQMVCLPDGRVFVHRKTHLSPVEEPHFSPGDSLSVFRHLDFGFGVQLCYEAHFPELTTNMVLAGAHVLFVPHASPRGDAEEKEASWLRHLAARAFDNGAYVVAMNQSGENAAGLSFPGLALVLDPVGKVADRFHGEEGMLVADLWAERLNRVRTHRMTSFLSRRQPSLYAKGVIKQNIYEGW